LQLVASVLGARAEELFNVIKKVVKEKDLEYELNGGFVLTGGGALIRNIVDLAEFILEKPAKIGIPQSVGRMTNVMKDPKFSTVLGLMQESIGQIESGVIVEESNEFDIISKLGSSLKNVFKEIF
jgi:cell division protein FtsA